MKWPFSHVFPPLTSLSLPQTSQILLAMSNSCRASRVATGRVIQRILGLVEYITNSFWFVANRRDQTQPPLTVFDALTEAAFSFQETGAHF
jgi:hypothetical protein